MFDWFRKFVLFLVGVSLPMQAFSLFNVGGFYVTPTKAVAGILLAIGLLQFVVTGRRWPRNRKNVWVYVFLTSCAISCLMGLLIRVPLTNILIVLSTYSLLVAYYFLITYVVNNRNDLTLLLWSIVLGGVVTAVPTTLGFTASVESAQGVRYEGFGGEENRFGYDMAVVIPVAMALFFTNRSQLRKALLVAGAGIALAGLLLSLSRTAFVALGGMWALWVYRSGRLDSVKYVVPAFVLLVGLAYVAPESVMARIQTMTDPQQRAEDSSIQGRLIQYEFATKAFLRNPLFGTGRFNFTEWAADQEGGWKVDYHTIHNTYLARAAYQGLLGLVPFLMILFLTWRDYGRVRLAALKYRGYGDPLLSEYGHYAVFLQIAFFGTVLGNTFLEAIVYKSQWTLLALSTVLYTLAEARLRELETQPHTPEETRASLGTADYGLPGRPEGASA